MKNGKLIWVSLALMAVLVIIANALVLGQAFWIGKLAIRIGFLQQKQTEMIIVLNDMEISKRLTSLEEAHVGSE